MWRHLLSKIVGVSFTVHHQKRPLILQNLITVTYDFPNLSATNSLSEGLIDTPDKKTNVCSDESPFNSPFLKKLKFTSTPNKYTPLASSYVAEIKVKIMSYA